MVSPFGLAPLTRISAAGCDFDFAVVEQCFQYHECGRFSPFIAAGKAVFEAEYELAPRRYCERAKALRFSAVRKSYDLRARPWEPCG
jgi:hypothetical protein